MVILRGTANLLQRLGGPVGASPLPSTTRLGDGTPTSSAGCRLPAAVGDVLRALGLPAEVVEKELAEMTEVPVEKTASRSILGSMNDFDRMLRFGDPCAEPLLAQALELAEAPCGPIGMESPNRARLGLLLGGIPPSGGSYHRAAMDAGSPTRALEAPSPGNIGGRTCLQGHEGRSVRLCW